MGAWLLQGHRAGGEFSPGFAVAGSCGAVLPGAAKRLGWRSWWRSDAHSSMRPQPEEALKSGNQLVKPPQAGLWCSCRGENQ